MKITIVGLGSGDISSISLKAYRILTSSDNIFLRTENHPVVDSLVEDGMNYRSFDYIYDKSDDFESCYDEISNIIISESQSDDVVYAVPGHPCVAEKSVERLVRLSREKGIETEIISSTSFLDDMFVFLEFDPSKGFTLVDALDFNEKKIGLCNSLVFTQVYDRFIASELKLKLMDIIADDTDIIIFKAAGIKSLEKKISLKLYELDRYDFEFDHLSSVFVPFPYAEKNQSMSGFVETIEVLRGENGCPWDREQTRESLMPQFYEELDEFRDAVRNNDIDNIIEELGDLLLHIVLQAQIGKEEELFDIDDIINGINEKIIRRHPHVFGEEEAFTKEDVNIIWERIKKEEKLTK